MCNVYFLNKFDNSSSHSRDHNLIFPHQGNAFYLCLLPPKRYCFYYCKWLLSLPHEILGAEYISSVLMERYFVMTLRPL